MTIIGQGWAKFRDIWDTNKSRYFAITEFVVFIIVRSQITLWKVSEAICHFHARVIARSRKRGFIHTWAEYNLQPNTVGWHCAFKQTIICRQLFADYVVGFWPMKRERNLHQMMLYIQWTMLRIDIKEYFWYGEVSNYILSWFVYLLLQIASICHVIS